MPPKDPSCDVSFQTDADWCLSASDDVGCPAVLSCKKCGLPCSTFYVTCMHSDKDMCESQDKMNKTREVGARESAKIGGVAGSLETCQGVYSG